MNTLLSKIATPIIAGVLLVLVIVLGVSTLVQSIRLNGFGLLGWTITEGYRPMAERLGNDNARLIGNNLAVSSALDKCNGGVAALEKARSTFAKAAQDLVDEKLRLQADYNRRVARLGAIKPTSAVCPSVDNIFNTGFSK